MMKLYDALLLDPVFLLEAAAKGKQVKLACAYEKVVIKALKAGGAAGKIKSPACDDSNKVDADFKYDGVIYPLEIKYDTHSFLYAGGLRYNSETGEFSPTNKGKTEVDQEQLEMFHFVMSYFPELEKLKANFDKIIEFITKGMSKAAGERKRISKGFPIQSTDALWNKVAKSKIGSISSHPKVVKMENFSEFFTKSKNIDYIQLGNYGVFYLNNNPANLPIPQLTGEIQLELKWKTGGLKKDRKVPTRTIGVEIIGRFKSINSSPYSLDNPESIRSLFNTNKK